MVSVLAERAAYEGPRSTRAVETIPAASEESMGAGLRQRQIKPFAFAGAVFSQ